MNDTFRNILIALVCTTLIIFIPLGLVLIGVEYWHIAVIFVSLLILAYLSVYTSQKKFPKSKFAKYSKEFLEFLKNLSI